VVFLGYSLPDADLHARFILRCGFHNQVEGEVVSGGKRSTPTGKAEVVIVNPDRGAAGRIERGVGNHICCDRQPIAVAEWIEQQSIQERGTVARVHQVHNRSSAVVPRSRDHVGTSAET
jgi:hypothetical protein